MSVQAPSRTAAFAARLLVVLALVVVSAPLLGASPASAVVDGGFEIDGDLTAAGNLDWSNVPGQPAMRDVVSAAGDDGFKSGSTSKEEDADNWDLVTAAVTPNANDIGDIYGYGRLLDGHQWAFVGFERAATGGSTSFNIEFNARGNKVNKNGVSVPDRQAGDILIDVQQQGSGSIVVGGVYQWSGSWVYSPAAAAVVSSAYNTGAVTDVDGSSLPAGQFAEISIDITRALGQASACPGLPVTTLNIRSRSSASSITSTLKDYIKPASLGVPTGCGGLTIQKKDGSGAALPGAGFSISPNPVAASPATLTVTDGGANDPDGAANGTIAFTGAKPGSYTVTETTPPTGYLYSSAPIAATVTGGSTTTVPVVNTLGSASWTKVDATSGDAVGGATFTVTGTGGAAQTMVATPVTVVDNGARDTDPAAGAVTVAGLPTGTYAVRETVPPTGYDLPTSGNPKSFSVTQAAPNPTVAAAFSDPRKKGSVVVTKTDAVSGAPLDATFRLWRDNGDGAFSAADTPVGSPTQSAGGTLTFPDLTWGRYWVEETVPPTGYLVDPDLPRLVTVNAASLNPTVAVADPRRPSRLTVTKVDDADGRPLADARMRLWRDSDGVAGPSAGDTAAGTCDTAADGTCSVAGLGFGTFYWQEVTPPPNYLLPAAPYSSPVTINAGNAGTVLPTRTFRDVEIALAAHLTKTGTLADEDGDHLADVGEVIGYTFTLRNDGNASLSGLAVTDPKVGAVSCPTTPVPVGGSAQCTATYVVTQADIDHGSVDNAATATAQGPNGVTAGSNEATHSLPVDDSSSVELDKQARLQDTDGDGFADEGETIRFVFTVTNTGNDSLHGATVDDPTLGGVTCPADTFAPGDHVTCTRDYVVTAADVDNGSVTNVATAAALDTDGGTVTSAADDTVTPTDTPTAIRLVKTGTLSDAVVNGGDGDGKADVGETVTWTFQVFNDGKATLHGVTIDDPSLGPVTCLVTSVAPGASVTCVKSALVTQADVDRGAVVNVATASGTPTGRPTVTSEESGDRVDADSRAALSLVKKGDLVDADRDGLADAGETVDYTFTVTNDGTTTLHGASVDDPRIASVDCAAGDLLPGKSVTCTASYVVTQADVDHGSVDNTATAGALDPQDRTVVSGESTDSIDADHRTAVSLDKAATLLDADGDDLADAGETVAYAFTVTNDGTTTVHDVTVDDPKLAAVPVAVTCPAGDVLPGKSVTCTASYVVTQADVDAGTVHNAATASATGPGGTEVTSDGDEADVDTDSRAALSLVKKGDLADEDGDGLADAGETVDYTFTVTNDGTTTVHGVTVDDPRIASVDCPAGDLLPGKDAVCTASYVVTQADVDHGSVDNTATASATPATGPATVESGEATDTLPADTRSAVSLVKTGTLVDDVAAGGDGDGLADAGETVGYAFVVTNDGTTTLHDVAVDDPKLAAVPATVSCPTGDVLPGKSVTCTASYVVTQADVDAGVVRNVATATAAPPSGPRVGSTPSDDEITADAASGLTVLKTGTVADASPAGDGDGLADVDETVDYTFTVTNTGTVTLTDVRVDDPRIAAVDCPTGDLLPGKDVTCTGSYVVTQADVDAGSVVNTATASATGPGASGVSSGESTETLPADDAAAVRLAKFADLADADGDGRADLGETVDYRFVVTNDGNVTLHDVAVDDPKLAAVPATVSCPTGDVAPGEDVTCAASYVVTQADVDAGSVANTATASAATPHAGRVGSTEAEADVPADTHAALSIDKRATLADSVADGGDGDGLADAGERIDYTFVVTNDGAVTVSGVTVDDPMLAGLPVPVVVSCPDVALAPGRSLECSAAYTVRQADVDRGEVANVASASGVPAASSPGVDSQPDTTHTSTDTRSAVSLVKSGELADSVASGGDGDGLADAGERVDYAFEVTNDGTTTLHGLAVDDPMLAAVPVAVSCPAGDLLPGDAATCTASYVVTQADVDAGVVRNVATASAAGPDDTTLTSAPSDVEVAADATDGLALLKTGALVDAVVDGGDGDGLADVGETVHYSFEVRNTGTVTLTGVRVDDPRVPSVDCPAGDLAPGAAVTCTGSYVVTQADVDAGEVVNTAVATAVRSGDQGAVAPRVSSNESTETLTADARSGLAIDKSAGLRDRDGDDRADEGELIDYSFLVTNTGTVTMTGVAVVDPMLGTDAVTCPATTLAPGGSMTCTALHRVTDADLGTGTITNVAWAVGTPTGAGGCGPDGCTSEPDSVSVAAERTTIVTEPGETPDETTPDDHDTTVSSPEAGSTPQGGSTPTGGLLPNTGGPAAGLAGLGLLAVLAGVVALVRSRRRDEDAA